MSYEIISVDELDITGLELSRILNSMDINISNAVDENEALAILDKEKDRIDAIVWTINSNDCRHFDSIKRLKSMEEYKSIPVIIVSGFTGKKHIIKAIESGAVEYIAKPYDEAAVIKKMSKILGVVLENNSISSTEDDFIIFNFTEMLSREIKAASRGEYALSIMRVAFINGTDDSVEQDAIDEITSLANRIIRIKLRETDTAFCYNNSSIILLLPFADSKGAKNVERSIRKIISTHSVIKQKSIHFKLVSAVVSYPEDGKVKDSLLDKLEARYKDGVKSTVFGYSADNDPC